MHSILFQVLFKIFTVESSVFIFSSWTDYSLPTTFSYSIRRILLIVVQSLLRPRDLCISIVISCCIDHFSYKIHSARGNFLA
ncbi:hypothetical protein C0J52_13963 [Blattella germanica]|nr:hypothetical protein C0J52_13963 [Blattella germanica]